MEIIRVKTKVFERVEVEKEVDKFVANDGTLFNYKYECEEYEEKLELFNKVIKLDIFSGFESLLSTKSRWGFKTWFKVHDLYEFNNIVKLVEEFGIFGNDLNETYDHLDDVIENAINLHNIENKIKVSGYIWVSFGVVNRELYDYEYSASPNVTTINCIILDDLLKDIEDIKNKLVDGNKI